MRLSSLSIWLGATAALSPLAASFQVVAPTLTFHSSPYITTTTTTTTVTTLSLSADTATPTADVSSDTSSTTELLSRDRYIASNRFTVRKGKEAKFEKRWATRKSRLSSLPGFKYFHLMRRVALDNDVNSGIDPQQQEGDVLGNYVSFTIWNTKKDFMTWRSGDAFKEAHGGTSISAFLGTMIKSALILKGPPRVALYDGLLQQSAMPDTIPETVDGWRNVVADGQNILPAECFVACNQFFVPNDNAQSFEQRWAGRESALKECEGFVSFSLLRRNTSMKGHGMAPLKDDEPTYVSTTIWKDRESFTKWKEGSAFQKAHGGKKGEGGERPKPLWTRPPEPVFYEGTLVITTEEGA